MGYTLAEKIIKEHIVDGEMVKGTAIGLRIDQTLTQDATGTMAYLEFEAMGVPRVKTEKSVAYIDHNTLQVLKMLMTTDLFSLFVRNMVSTLANRVMVFVTRYT